MECVLMVLNHVKEDQIESCISGLSLEELDVLVKYVYKGLGIPRNNGPLFKWHAKVRGIVTNFTAWRIERAGHGALG